MSSCSPSCFAPEQTCPQRQGERGVTNMKTFAWKTLICTASALSPGRYDDRSQTETLSFVCLFVSLQAVVRNESAGSRCMQSNDNTVKISADDRGMSADETMWPLFPLQVVQRMMWLMDHVFKYTNFGLVSLIHGDFFIRQVKCH